VSLGVVYPGTFDPVTRGHLDIAARAVEVFGSLRIAVVRTSLKSLVFPAEARAELVRSSLVESGIEGIEVSLFDGLLMDYMRSNGASVYIRGLRANSDFEYEFQMQLINRKLAPGMTGLYLMPGENYIYLSSTVVREVAALGGSLSEFVTPSVERALRERYPRGAPGR
jgi:pantetheine-phosphate adenylyltransferase